MTESEKALNNVLSSRKNAIANSTATMVTGDIVNEEKETSEEEKDNVSNCQD